MVKEFEGDAWSIIFKLHHYHTKSNVAQHDIITLTTDITNLTLNDSWKGTVRQFLSHFKEKLRLLDSLVPVSDQLPETTRITFLKRAVQQNHDLRQIHVMDSVWRFKTDSTDALTFDTYYNLLWDAAHQYDLHQIKKGPQRKAFFSHQEEISDDDEYANVGDQFPLIQNQRNILHIQFINHHFTPRCHKRLSSLLTSGKHFLRAPRR